MLAPHVAHGKSIQYVKNDTSQPLDEKGIKLVQSIVGSTSHGARLIDNTALVAINELGSQQSTSTTNTITLCSWLLDYVATCPNPSITFRSSDMILCVASESSYSSVANSRSRVGGCHFLGNQPKLNVPLADQIIFHNAPTHVEASILKSVMSAASESEIAAAYVNAKLAVPIRICLLEMGHHQPATPLEIDNTTAYGILTKQLMPKRSKSIEMRFYWLRDRENQRQFQLYWKKAC